MGCLFDHRHPCRIIECTRRSGQKRRAHDDMSTEVASVDTSRLNVVDV